jgi:predicted nucleotidyltransferase
MLQSATLVLPPVVQMIVERLSVLPQVRALALAGSQVTARADERSDFDIYVYHDAEVPVPLRAKLAAEFAERMDIDSRFWGPGDEWIIAATGVKIDLIYFAADWIEAQLERVLIRHMASVGYSTSFWHTVRHSRPLSDRDGWFAALQSLAAQPYPEPLRRAIVANNHPILRHTLSSRCIRSSRRLRATT